MIRLFAHIPVHIVRWSAYLLLLLVVLFFGLTRTEVGREALRVQIENEFARIFEGRLTIDLLSGNLVNDLYARNVRLLDPEGEPVIVIDSVSLRPRWRDLLRQRLSIGSLTLFRPSITLVKSDSLDWNLARTLKRRMPRDDTDRELWALSSGDLRIIDGMISTTNEGATPGVVRDGHVFDFSNTTVDRLFARTTIDWNDSFKLIDLLEFSAGLPQLGTAIESLQGQLYNDRERTALSRIAVQLQGSSGRIDASIEGVDFLAHGLSLDSLQQAPLHLAIDDTFMDAAEIRSLFPSLPVNESTALAVSLDGALDDLTINRLSIVHGQTRIEGSGWIRGLPHTADFRYELAENRIDVEDLIRLAPESGIEEYAHLGVIDFSSRGDGSITLGESSFTSIPLAWNADVDLTGEMGNIVGRVELRRAANQPVTYSSQLIARQLNPAALANDHRMNASLNGTIHVSGLGTSLADLESDLTAAFHTSTALGRSLDSLNLSLRARGGIITGMAYLEQGHGMASVDGRVNLETDPISYDFHTITEMLDIGPLVGRDTLQSDLNLSMHVSGGGLSLRDLDGVVNLNIGRSSIGRRGYMREVPENRTTLRITNRSGESPHLQISGDIMEGEARGNFALDKLYETLSLWAGTYEGAFHEAFRHKLAGDASETAPVHADDNRPEGPFQVNSPPDDFREQVQQDAFETPVAAPLTVEATVRLKRADVLTAIWPAVPVVDGALDGNVSLTATADNLQLNVAATSQAVAGPGVRVQGLSLNIETAGRMDHSSNPSLSVSLGAASSHLTIFDQPFERFTVNADYDLESGSFELTSDRVGDVGNLRILAELTRLPDRNQITIQDFMLAIRDGLWVNTEPRVIDVFADAVIFQNVILENVTRNPEGEDLPSGSRVGLEGIISSNPSDTAAVFAESILLTEVSEVLALKRRVGGVLDGRVVLTSSGARSQTTGLLTVADLSFDGHRLGDFKASSLYTPGRDELMVEASVIQYDSVEVWQKNDLKASGILRLSPEFRDDMFDFQVEMNSADLFFFEYIFPDLLDDIRGYATGRGHIRGNLSYPLFSGSFEIPAAMFHVPDFGLRYTLSGPFTIDQQGFHLNEMVVADHTGGSTRVSGGILFNDYRFFSLDLVGQLDETQIMNVHASRDLPFYGEIWLSGVATLNGPISGTFLRSASLVASRRSQIYIPVRSSGLERDEGFIVFADSTGAVPDLEALQHRSSLLASRPVGERGFLDGMEMNLNMSAPRGTTVHLVFDPLLGDVIHAVGSGRIQLEVTEGTFSTYGTFTVDSGDYLFTAGEVFTRRFQLESGGTITWDGDPIDARLEIPATYRTRASLAGLPGYDAFRQRVPLIVHLNVLGRVNTPVVDLSLSVARDDRTSFGTFEGLEAVLNQDDRAAEYATSVLLTNTFLLTTSTGGETLSGAADDLFFNSVSQLVANQLNRFVNQALTNVELTLGVQSANTQDLDLTYGIALRLMDERLIIRGQGVYESASSRRHSESLQGEFVVEVRLNPRVSVEVFYRREEDLSNFTSLTSSMYGAYGAGLSYQTDFVNWRQFWQQITGWISGLFGRDQPEESVAHN